MYRESPFFNLLKYENQSEGAYKLQEEIEQQICVVRQREIFSRPASREAQQERAKRERRKQKTKK